MVRYKVKYGRLYHAPTGEEYDTGDVANIPREVGERLGYKVECIFSMEEFLDQNVGPISDAIKAGEYDDILHDIWDAESEGKERVTVVKAVRHRLEELN